MIFSSLRGGSSAPDGVVCHHRQDMLLNSKANGSVIQVLNNNNNNFNDHEEDQDKIDDAKRTSSNTKSLRRKRRELRRIKMLESNGRDRSISYDHDGFEKRKRLTSEIEQTEAKLAYVPGDDVVGSRSESHGVISIIGRRREMEDEVAVELGFLEWPGGGGGGVGGGRFYDFFGVYDGHGGWRVAEACGKRLHRLLVELIVAGEGYLHQSDEGGGGDGNMMIDWEKVMVDGFRKMDEEVNRHCGTAVATTGSTAVVAVVGEDQLVVANCGDSRAVLLRCGVAVQVSDDHKPDRQDELKRIEVSGGRVINWNGQRVLGVLATSRSIGDYYLKPFVVPVPEVRVINRTDTDEFLILASDGLWDVISNDVACQMVRKCFEGRTRNNPQNQKQDHGESRAVEAAAVLAELAIAQGSRDNVSVIVVELN